MALLVKKSGILTTVQDLGRTGARRFGINTNGVMDTTAARLINIVLGNDQNDAVLEIHFPAAKIEFKHDTVFALGGADFGAELDSEPVPVWSNAFAKKSSILKFREKRSGNRAYVAVKGGFQVDKWLGSSSTNLTAEIGGFHGRKLADDRIVCPESKDFRPLKIGSSLLPRYSRFPTVRVIPGAEFAMLTAVSEPIFLNEAFTVSADSNRMGFRLHGEPLHLLDTEEIISSAVDFGTIQLLPDGQMIILMADHQTSGGYPRLAHIVSQDLPVVAQLGPNDKLAFHLVTLNEAEEARLQFERDLRMFKMGCRFATV